jgi:hypothetical protein
VQYVVRVHISPGILFAPYAVHKLEGRIVGCSQLDAIQVVVLYCLLLGVSTRQNQCDGFTYIDLDACKLNILVCIPSPCECGAVSIKDKAEVDHRKKYLVEVE